MKIFISRMESYNEAMKLYVSCDDEAGTVVNGEVILTNNDLAAVADVTQLKTLLRERITPIINDVKSISTAKALIEANVGKTITL